ncbi:MAG: hypothetical protein QOE84_3354, partial [Actinomycetota bacterium]|nr:hypothetical protein [Actinomycetota bacterium]
VAVPGDDLPKLEHQATPASTSSLPR